MGKAQLTVRINTEIADQLRARADLEGITISDLIVRGIIRALTEPLTPTAQRRLERWREQFEQG